AVCSCIVSSSCRCRYGRSDPCRVRPLARYIPSDRENVRVNLSQASGDSDDTGLPRVRPCHRGGAKSMIRSVGIVTAAMTFGSPSRLEDTDAELIRRVVAKDRRAFELLYQRYAERLQHYLARLISKPDVTEEVLDDVMLVVWQNASRFDHTS